MVEVTSKAWKGLFILSILVPLTLFTGFKFTSNTGAPTIAETTRLEPTVWNREEPYAYNVIPGDPFLNVSYVGSDVVLSVSYWCGAGDFNDEESARGGTSLTSFGLKALNASVPEGFIVSVELAYKEPYQSSWASFSYLSNNSVRVVNANVTTLRSEAQVSGEKLYIKASAVGQPREVYMDEFWLTYHLSSPYNYTHQITIEATVTYFNGTVYKQLVQPVELVFGPDHNNSFDDAEEIGFGISRSDYVDDNMGDPADYFKIWLEEGQNVSISVFSPLPGETVRVGPPDVFIYNPNRSLEGCLLCGNNATLPMTLSVNQSGWWYAKVTTKKWLFCIYAIGVSIF